MKHVCACAAALLLIAVEGNPHENIAVMEDVRFVMKTGVIFKD